MKTDDFNSFVELYTGIYKNLQTDSKRWDNLDAVELLENQAFYVLDWRTGTLTFAKGFEKLLGLESSELCFLDVTQHLIHPEDRFKIAHFIKTTSQFCMENNIGIEAVIYVSYRIQNKVGEYIKVLRQSGPHEIDQDGKMISNFSFLNDISNFDSTTRINFDFCAKGFDVTEIKQKALEAIQTKTTEREREILECLSKGLTGKEIAERLFISTETVKFHRKNLFQKFSVKNTIELIKKADNEGIIIL